MIKFLTKGMTFCTSLDLCMVVHDYTDWQGGKRTSQEDRIDGEERNQKEQEKVRVGSLC